MWTEDGVDLRPVAVALTKSFKQLQDWPRCWEHVALDLTWKSFLSLFKGFFEGSCREPPPPNGDGACKNTINPDAEAINPET